MTSRLLSALSVMTLVGTGFLVAVNSTPAEAAPGDDDLYIDESFQTQDLSSDWLAIGRDGNDPRIVQPTDGDGPGDSRWLQLTSDETHSGNGESGFVLNNTAFSSSKGVVIEYDQRIYRTNHGMGGVDNGHAAGDGLSMFLVDADIANSNTGKGSGVGTSIDTSTNEAGGFGAGLGYSSVAGPDETWCGPNQQQGVAGGWFGLGFDVYGNYANSDHDDRGHYITGRTRPHMVSGGFNMDNTENTSVPPRKTTRQMVGLRGSGVRHEIVPGGDTTCDLQAGVPSLNYWYGKNRSGHGDVVTHGGYQWIKGEQPTQELDNPFYQANEYLKVRVILTPGTGRNVDIKVQMTGKVDVANDVLVDGEWGTSPTYPVEYNDVLEHNIGAEFLQADLPDTFKIGFGASTGYAVNYHQIRNLRVFAPVDLSLTKSVSDDTPNVGDQISYTLGVTNNGPTDLSPDFPATITDGLDDLPLGDVTWTATASAGAEVRKGGDTTWVATVSGTGPIGDGDLEWHGPGASNVQVIVSGTVTTPTAWDTALTNTAVVTASTLGGPQEVDLSNNQDTATISIPAQPHLTITKDDGVERVSIGQTTTYDLTVTNTGPAAATNSIITDTLPAGLEYVSSTPGGASTAPGAGGTTIVTFPAATVPATGSLSGYSVTAKVVTGATSPLTNTVGIRADNDCVATPLAERCEDEDVNVLDEPEWNIVKSSDKSGEVAVGDTISYTVTATNDGPGPVLGAVLTDDLSGVLVHGTFLPGSALVSVDGGTPIPVTGPPGGATTLTTPPITIPQGQAAVLTYQVTVRSDARGHTLRNAVTGTAVTTPPSTCADPATAGTEVGCFTEHPVIGQYFLKKVNAQGDTLTGAQFQVHADDNGGVGAAIGPVITAGNAAPINGLASGTYWLQEIKAPTGYVLLAEPVRFTVETGATPALSIVDADDAPVTDGPVTVLEDGLTIQVEDVPVLVLPDTGGAGTGTHMLFGASLLLAAVLILAQCARRMRLTADQGRGGALTS